MPTLNNGVLVKNEAELGQVIKTKEKAIALIYATWCPFCVSFLPLFKKYAQNRDGFILIEDDRWVLADKYNVEVVPTILYFENGRVTKRLDGVLGVGLDEGKLEKFVKECGY